VKRGRLQKTIAPSSGKSWPAGVPLSLQIDFVLHQQAYPVTQLIGQNFSELQIRGVAESHVLLYGIRSQTTIVPEVPSPVPDGMATVDDSGGWGCVVGGEIAAVAPAEIKGDGLPYVVRIAGRTNLPENTRVRLQVFRENSEIVLHRRDVTVRGGVFTASVPVKAAEGYRIVAMVSPDFQYQAVKRILGFAGEQIQARGVDLGEMLYGLRYPLDLEGTW